jgi:outer membrane receptor protein involved in Fe transport
MNFDLSKIKLIHQGNSVMTKINIFENASLTAIAASILLASPAFAQGEDAPKAQGGDIVVTASKRAAMTVQDVPIAVQALSGSDLKAKGALDFADYFHSVAGLSAQDEGPGDKRYIIRGINSAGAGTVGVYLDEVIITGENSQDGSGQAADIKLFDIDRVEVLKGPQGTTFGSSALSGTIRYITTKPKLDEVGGYMQSALRATDGAALGFQTDGAINLPIVPGVFAIRASGYYANLPGWIDNRFEKNANNEESRAARLEARWQITDGLTLDAMAMYQKLHQDAKNYYNTMDYDGNAIAGSGYQQNDYARSPYDDKSQIYNATLTYKQDWGTITATGSRFVRDTLFMRDASLAADAYLGLDYDGVGRSSLRQAKHRRIDSAELRYASDFDGPFQLLVGGFLQNEKRDFASSWPFALPTGYIDEDAGYLLDRAVFTSVKERALFGEASYDFTPELTGTVGLRYYDIKLREQSATYVTFPAQPGSGLSDVFRYKDNGFIPRFNLAYKVSPDVNTYVQVAKGYRPGGTNDTTAAEFANVSIPQGYNSDAVWNYEFGLKTALLDNTLNFNTALYYIEWSDIQTSNLAYAPNGPASFGYTGNGGKASVRGVEVTIDYRPMQGLEINYSSNYSRARLDKDNPNPATGLEGNRIPYVPTWSSSLGATYRFPLDSLGVNANVGGDVSYQGKSATQFNSTIANYHKLDSYALVNLRAGISKDQWSVTLIANNLFNDHTITNYNNIQVGLYPDGYYMNRPRTIALSASFNF